MSERKSLSVETISAIAKLIEHELGEPQLGVLVLFNKATASNVLDAMVKGERVLPKYAEYRLISFGTPAHLIRTIAHALMPPDDMDELIQRVEGKLKEGH